MTLGTIWGIKIRLNWWFLMLLFVYLLLDIWIQALGVFLVVLWHECWHVIVAKYNGLKVREIELLPYGGVAKIEGLVGKGSNLEAKVALAGPISNFVLASLITAGLYWGWFYHPFAYFIFMYNILIGLFNLLPVLPLDGGRILRGYLSNYWGVILTTTWIARLGQLIAVTMIVSGAIGLYFGLVTFHLIIIAIFLWWGAQREKEQAFYHHWLNIIAKKQTNLQEKVLPGFTLIARPDLPIKELFAKLSPTKYNMITVIDSAGDSQGVISEEKLITLIDSGNYDQTVGQLLKVG